MQPLNGLHLLITRPEGQATPWAKQLQALGATTTTQAMLVIQAIDERSNKQGFEAIKHQTLKLDEYQKIIFVSQNAVAHFMPWLDQYWPQLPVGLEFFAIGSATATQLSTHLNQLDSVAGGHTGSAMNSEALLAHPLLQHVRDEKIALVRGLGGRTLLSDTLSARGATVESIAVYERIAPAINDWDAVQTFIGETKSQCKLITAHSAETIENLCKITPKPLLEKLIKLPLLVPGKRVCDYGYQSGFNTIITAHNATHESMIEALYDWQQHNG